MAGHSQSEVSVAEVRQAKGDGGGADWLGWCWRLERGRRWTMSSPY